MANDLGLPKLTIRPYTEEELGRRPLPAALNDLSVQLDGVEVKGLRSLNIGLNHNEVNIAEMEFVVGELDVDIEALQEIQANIKREAEADREHTA